MVGFKNVSLVAIIFVSMVLIGCVPQAKKTECGDGQAFSASLRSCVPITPGEDQFITIRNEFPTAPVTIAASSNVPLTFSIGVNNPYARPYRVKWTKSHASAGTTTLYSMDAASSNNANHTLTWALTPVTQMIYLGSHVITAEIFDASGVTLDSHHFQVILSSNPSPSINNFFPVTTLNAPILPAATHTFTVTTHSNGAVTTSPRIEWRLSKLTGTPLADRTDATTLNYGSGTTATANFPVLTTNPLLNGSSVNDLVGTYSLSATLLNGAIIYDYKIWTMVLSHAALGRVTAVSSPLQGVTVTAYDGIHYGDRPVWPAASTNYINFAYSGIQAQFCVAVSDGDGRYGGGVRVRYYLGNDANEIYEGITSSVVNTICLDDDPDKLLPLPTVFSGSNLTNWSSQIRVRLWDVDTGEEYTNTNTTWSGVTYPIYWNMLIKPTNVAPTVSFTSFANMSGVTSCAAATSPTRTCNVTQGTQFSIGMDVTDEFYDTSSTNDDQQQNLTYSMILYRNGVAVPGQSCTKTTADVSNGGSPPNDDVGPTYLCNFTIAHYDGSGPIDPSTGSYSVAISFSDTGSPLTGATAKTSPTYTYNLVVAEDNTAPTILPQGNNTINSYVANSNTPATALDFGFGDSITEGETLNFEIRVSDLERDSHQIQIYHCTDGTLACATESLVASQTVLSTTNDLVKTTRLGYLLPEDLVPLTSALNINVPVYFRVVVGDIPHTIPGLITSDIFSVNVKNKNPAPVVVVATESPVSAPTTHNVAVGMPFSINPGNITDASLVASERNFEYQWYVSTDDLSYSAIGGATSRVLTWTPSAGFGTTAYLKMCVSDGTTIYPVSNDFAAVCTGSRASNSFLINIISNESNFAMTSVAGTVVPGSAAIWHDTTTGNTNVAYAAYAEYNGVDNYFINVEKIVRNSTTWVIDSSFETVRFAALSTGNSILPTALSITGSGNSLYIAYKCAAAGTPPGTPTNACIRRIEKSYTSGSEEKAGLAHKGKFGFRYTGITITVGGTITYSAPATGNNYVIDFSGGVPAPGVGLTINGLPFTASNDGDLAADLSDYEICSTSTPGCTISASAQRLVHLINGRDLSILGPYTSRTEPGLQGLTARLSGSNVIITGMKSGDFFTSTTTVSGIGKIFIHPTSNTWNLPVINSSLTGSNLNRISVMSGTVDSHLSSTVTVTTLITPTLTADVDRASFVTNDIDKNGNLVLALISSEPTRVGQGRLYRVAHGGSVYNGALVTQSLFGTATLSSMRLSGSRSNNTFNYVLAYANVSGKWLLGRYDETALALNNSAQQELIMLAANGSTGASNIVDASVVQDMQVITDPFINGEARLAVTYDDGVGLLNDGFYLLRFSSSNALTCPEDSINQDCLPINTFTTDANSRVFLSHAQSSASIGNAGNTANENVSDIVHAIMFDNTPNPKYGYFNIVPESIQGDHTSNPDGSSGWRPPYVK